MFQRRYYPHPPRQTCHWQQSVYEPNMHRPNVAEADELWSGCWEIDNATWKMPKKGPGSGNPPASINIIWLFETINTFTTCLGTHTYIYISTHSNTHAHTIYRYILLYYNSARRAMIKLGPLKPLCMITWPRQLAASCRPNKHIFGLPILFPKKRITVIWLGNSTCPPFFVANMDAHSSERLPPNHRID